MSKGVWAWAVLEQSQAVSARSLQIYLRRISDLTGSSGACVLSDGRSGLLLAKQTAVMRQ